MAVQTSVSTTPNASRAGTVQRAYKTPVIFSRVCDETLGIPFGVLVVRDGSDRKVDLPVTAAEVQSALAGWSVLDNTLPYDSTGIPTGDGMAILYEGVIDAVCEEAVTQGEDVYVRHTSDGGSNTALGTVRNDSDSGRCAKRPGAIFAESTTAAGYARVLQAGPGASAAQLVALTVSAADVSDPTAGDGRVVSPVSGRIVAIYSVLGAAITVADATVTCKIGTTAITTGVLTITQSGSAAGDVDSAIPTALNYVTAGQMIHADSDGASTTTAPITYTFLIQVG